MATSKAGSNPRSAGENMYLSFLSGSRKDQEKGKDKNTGTSLKKI